MEGDKVQVSIRVRPLIQREKDAGDTINWKYDKNLIQAYNPETKCLTGQPYTFDGIFHDKVDTAEVYHQVVSPIVEKSLQGYNGTVLCYGQTSSGKTHTLYGTEKEDGIISLTAKHLFQLINGDETRTYYIRVGLLEVYNEKVSDLLNNGSHVEIKDKNGVAFPHDLKELEVFNSQEMLSAAKTVQAKRKIGETQMNKESSRSHTIVRILIESVPNDNEEENDFEEKQVQVTNALLNFVDLAGSEKASQTGAVGERFKEATFINKSLSVLSQVVLQLSTMANSTTTSSSHSNSSINLPQSCQSSTKQPAPKYINYRDSKLTRILQSSLSGNAYISLIFNITPAAVDETHSTLRFARTAKNIKVGPTKNRGPPTGAQYRTKITELENLLVGKTSELEILRKQIVSMQKFCKPHERVSVASQPDRRKTMCPSMLRKQLAAAEFRPIVDDFKIPSVPIRRSFAQVISNDTSNTVYLDFPVAAFDKRLHPLREETAAQIKPNTVDASTETDFVDPPGETTILLEASKVTAEKWQMEKEHNQSIRQEWFSEKSFLQHEYEVVLEDTETRFQSSLDSMKELLDRKDAEKRIVEEECEKLKKSNAALEKEMREYFEELHTIKIRMGKANTENLALKQGLEEYEVVKTQLAELQSEVQGKQKFQDEFTKVQELEKVRHELACENNLLKVELTNGRTGLETLQEQCSTLRSEKDCLNSELEKLQHERSQIMSVQETMKEKLAVAEAEVSSTKQSLQAAEMIKLKEQSSLDSIKEVLQHKEVEMQNTLEECDKLKKNNAALENEVTVQLEELQATKIQLGDASTEILNLKQGLEEFVGVKSKLLELESELQDKKVLQEQFKKQADRIQDLEKSQKEFDLENNHLREQCAVARCQLEKLQSNIQDKIICEGELKEQIESLQHREMSHMELISENTQLKEEYEVVKSLLEELESDVQDKQTMQDEFNIQVAKAQDLEKSLNELTLKNTYIEEEHRILKSQLTELQLNSQEKQIFEDELKEKNEDLEKLRIELSLENDKLKQEHEIFKTQLEVSQSVLEEKIKCENEFRDQTEKLQQIEMSRNELISENKQLKEDYEVVKTLLEDLESDSHEKPEFEDEIKEQVKRIEDLEKLRDELYAENKQLKEEYEVVKSLLEELESDVQDKQTMQDEFNIQVAKAQDLEKSLNELTLKNTYIEEEHRILKSQLTELQINYQEKQKFEDELKSQKEKIQELEKLRIELSLENDNLKQEHEIFKTQLEVSQSVLEEKIKYENEFRDQTEKLQQIEMSRNELISENKQLKEDYEVVKSLLEELNTDSQEKQEFEDELKNQEEKNQDLEKLLNELSLENDKLKQEHEIFKTQLEVSQSVLEEKIKYENEFRDQTEKLQQIEMSRNELISENKQLKEDYEVVKSLLEELETDSQEKQEFEDELKNQKEKIQEVEKLRNELSLENDKLKQEHEIFKTQLEVSQSVLEEKIKCENEFRDQTEKLQQIEMSRNELISENKQLKEDYEVVKTLLEDLESDSHEKPEFEDELKEQVKRVEDLEKLRDELYVENKQLQEEHEVFKYQLADLQLELQNKMNFQDEHNDYKGKLLDMEKLRNELAFENRQLKEAHEVLKSQLEQLQSNSQDMMKQHELKELLQRVDDLEKSRNELAVENNQLKERHEVLKSRLEELKSESEDKQTFEDELREQVERVQDLEKVRHELVVENNHLQEKWTSSIADIGNMQEQCSTLRSEKDCLNSELEKLQHESSQIMSVQETLKEKLAVAEAEVSSTKQSLQAAVDNAEMIKLKEQSSLDSIKEVLQHKVVEMQNTLEECDKLKKSNAALENEVRERFEELRIFKIQIDEVNAENLALKNGLEEFEVLKSQLKELQSDLEIKKNLQETFIDHTEKYQELERSRNELILENNQLKEEYEVVKSLLEELESDIKDKQGLEDALKELAEKFEDLDSLRHKLTLENNQLKLERVNSITDVEKLNEQYAHLRSEKDDRILELEKLKYEHSQIISSHVTLQERLIATEEEISSTKQSLQAAVDLVEMMKSKEENSLASVKEVFLQKEAEKQNVLEECEKLRQSKLALEKELSKHFEELQSIKVKMGEANLEFQDGLKEQVSKVQELEKIRRELVVENNHLNEERTNSITNIGKIQEQCAILLSEKDCLKSELKKLQTERSQIISLQQALKERLEIAEAEVSSTQLSLQTAADQLATAHADMLKFKEDSKKQLEAIRLEKNTSDSDWLSKNNQLSSDVKSAHKEINELQAKLQQSECLLNELNSNLSCAKEEVSQKLVIISDLQTRLQIEESKENQPFQPKPKLRSVGVETSSSVDIEKQRRHWQIKWERSEHLRKKESKELADNVYYKSEEIKNLLKKLNQSEEISSRLSTNVLYLEGEVDRYKELVPETVERKETEVQCDIIQELMFRVRRGDKFKLPVELGLPDFPTILEESRNLKGEVAVLKFWQSRCTCNKQGHLARPQARVPDYPRRRVVSASTAIPSDTTTIQPPSALVSQHITNAPCIGSTPICSNSTASCQQPRANSNQPAAVNSQPVKMPKTTDVVKKPKFDPFSEPLISLEELSKNF